MKILIAFTVVVVLIAFYVSWLRPWMKTTVWGAKVLDTIEPIERALWLKSETIFWARSKVVIGIVLTVLTQAGTIDITPLMPIVPDAWEPMLKAIWSALPMTISIMGLIDEKLRKDTTKPIEIVAMRTDAPIDVKIAAAKAEAANEVAVVAAENAKVT